MAKSGIDLSLVFDNETERTREPVTMLHVAPVGWSGHANAMSPANREELTKTLDSIAERAARLAAYFAMRSGGGCGDQGHEAAVKEQNRVGRLVQSILSYHTTRDLSF
jgi:hypothetical protein